jgi:NADH-quinone oxidoreductase subunit A
MLDDGLANTYLPILVFFFIAAGLATVLVIFPFLIGKLNGYKAKTSSYECGFEAFDHTRSKFDIRFYLVSILFIIFDLEVVLMFPWAASFSELGLLGFWAMIIFLIILAIGFIYEWRKGALDWE